MLYGLVKPVRRLVLLQRRARPARPTGRQVTLQGLRWRLTLLRRCGNLQRWRRVGYELLGLAEPGLYFGMSCV